MATWSVAGNVMTLSLTGGDSGPISRHFDPPGLEADELYTFYLLVNTDNLPVQAFVEVDGGAQVIATVTGAHVLVVQGTTDGAGAIRLRAGVLVSEAIETSADNDDLDYADEAALGAGGWAETDTITAGGWFPATGTTTMSSSHVHGAGAKALLVEFSGQTFNFDYIYRRRTFGGYTPGQSVSASAWAWASAASAGRMGIRMNGDDSLPAFPTNYFFTGEYGAFKHLFVTGVADGSGNVVIDLGIFVIGAGSNALRSIWFSEVELSTLGGAGSATIEFSELDFCLGSGVGDGNTGAGGGDDDGEGGTTPPNDPIPDPPPGGWPPPPVPLDRSYGLFNAPVGGIGPVETTIVWLTPGNTVDLINKARTAGTRLFVMFGAGERVYKTNVSGSNGLFTYTLWKAAVLAIYTDARARAALEAGIADGTVVATLLVDEPFRRDGRYGGTIAWGTIGTMAAFVKSLWSTLTTMITADMVDQAWYVTSKLPALDWIISDYSYNRGDCTTWRDKCLDRCAAFGYGSGLALHYLHIEYPNDGSRAATPAEIRHLGGIIARPGGSTGTRRTVANVGWKYDATMAAQAGFWDAMIANRDIYAST